MNTNFEYYKVFYYVAKYGNLTKAAAVLSTSQPAVTRTIHKLENDVGCRLFTRSKYGMELTAEGKIFYEYVAAGCEQFFRGEDNLSNLISLENGTIHISATETALHCLLFQAMEDFNTIHPNVHFKILNNSTRKSIAALKEGKIDFAMVSSVPLSITKPLKMKNIKSYREILIGGKKYEDLLKGRKLSLTELSEYPWISLTSEAISRRFVELHFEQYGLSFSPDIELATTDMILPAVRHNLGIGFIPPEFAREDIHSGAVFEIEVEEVFPERNIIMIYDTEYPQSIASKAFRKFVISYQEEKWRDLGI